jgi:carbon-monoxide dehydrogenase medium subunit
VIPADFDYVRASSVEDALAQLRDGGEDAKVLAGGHSLIPLMKLRIAAPTMLVDIGGIKELAGVRRENGSIAIGALTTHAQAAADPSLGLVARAAGTIADQQVRNRGTVGGSLAHGDPASDLPAVVLAAEGTFTVRGADGGSREIPATEFFQDYWTTAVADGELLTEIRVPAPEGWSFGYQKFNRRQEDWAMVAVAVLLRQGPGGTVEDVRIGLTNMGTTPLRATAAEDLLRGQALTAEMIALAADQADAGTEPPADLNASSDYKRHLARVLCRRALEEAASGA